MVGLKCLVLLALLGLVCSHSVSLRRREHRVIRDEDMTLRERNQLIATGTTIPLDGGLLVLGTYVAPLSVGTPPVTVEMLIDTGSANTALPVVGCTSCEQAGGAGFNPSSSSTFTAMPCSSSACHQCVPSSSSCTDCADFFGSIYCSSASPSNCGFGITYGGGGTALQGYYGYDTACFGSLCANVTLSMIEAEIPAGNMNTGASTGILGLASEFNACNPTCVPPIFDEFVDANLVQNLFSMCLTPSNGGMLDLGTIDSSRYTGSIQYAPMTFDRWYNIEILDIMVGSYSLGLPPFVYGTTNDVIGSFVDSGTSVVLMNTMAFSAFEDTFMKHYGTLPGAKSLFEGSCVTERTIGDSINKYPNVTFVVASHDETAPLYLPVPPTSYLVGPVSVANLYCMGISAIPSVGVVLGDVFMENYYIVHDRANLQVGFAPVVAGNCQ